MSEKHTGYTEDYVYEQYAKLPAEIREYYPGHKPTDSPQRRADILVTYLEGVVYGTEKVVSWLYTPKGSKKTFCRYVHDGGQSHGKTRLEAIVKAAQGIRLADSLKHATTGWTLALYVDSMKVELMQGGAKEMTLMIHEDEDDSGPLACVRMNPAELVELRKAIDAAIDRIKEQP
jgi:hypothetical protein